MLGNDDIGWEDLLDPHVTCTMQRMAAQPVALCIQDTTELDVNGQAIAGLGPLSYEAQRGMYVHPTYVVTASADFSLRLITVAHSGTQCEISPIKNALLHCTAAGDGTCTRRSAPMLGAPNKKATR